MKEKRASNNSKRQERDQSLISENYAKKEATKWEILQDKIMGVVFGVLFIVLKSEEGNFWVEMIMLSTEVFQYFYIWKNALTPTLNVFLQYFSIINLFQDNYDMYLVVFYILFTLVILVFVDIFYVAIAFSRNKISVVWPIHLLRSVVSVIVTTLFMPIVEYFMGYLECNSYDEEGNYTNVYMNNNIQGLICYQGNFYVHATVGVIISIVFCSLCIVVQMIFYESKTKVGQENAKTNSKADLFALYVKIGLIGGYTFFSFERSYHWVLILFTFALSSVLFYTYWTERPFYDEKMNKAYLIYTGIFLWNNFVLLLGKVLNSTEFNGCLEVFIFGIPIICTIVLTESNDQYSLLLSNLNKLDKGESVIKQVRYFLELVDKQDVERKSKLKLKGFIQFHVENCVLENCPLKKYIEEPGKKESIAYLYQHAQTMFQGAISKFNSCTPLRLSYAFFLLERMNNKKQSLLELMNAEKYENSFEEQFLIYRFKKILEDSSSSNNKEEAEEGGLDVVSAIAYKNYFIEFRAGVVQACELFTEFWNQLRFADKDSEEGGDMEKLNEFGTKINATLEIVTSNFDKMQNLMVSDIVLLKIYSGFVGDILNNKDLAAIYMNRILELQTADEDDEEQAAGEEDNSLIPKNDECQYIVLSAENDDVGKISQISTGICNLFGYIKSEILGKKIEFLMPDQYQRGHQSVLYEKISAYKKQIAANLTQKNPKPYKPIPKEIYVYGKTKSRYLVPLNLKVWLMPSADGTELYFMARINAKETIKADDDNTANLNAQINQFKICHVITDENFVIQNFSSNAMNLLSLNNNSQGKTDITKLVKNFTEDFFKIETDEKTVEQILEAKRNIISSNYKNPSKIRWISDYLKSENDILSSVNVTTSPNMNSKGGTAADKKNSGTSGLLNKTPISKQSQKEEVFLLTASEIFVYGNHEGFIFSFEAVQSNSTKVTKKTLPSLKKTLNEPKKDTGSTNKLPGVDGNKMAIKRRNMISGKGLLDINHIKEERKQINFEEISQFEEKVEKNENIHIDQNFIPHFKSEFRLDSKNLTYISNPNQFDEIHHYVKEQAEAKFNFVKTFGIKKETEINSDTESSRGNTIKEEEFEELQNIEQEKTEVIAEKPIEDVSNSKDKMLNNYYHVDSAQIKFLIFDYKRDELIELKDRERMSQVEFRKHEETKKDEKIEKYKQELAELKEKKRKEDPDGEQVELTNNEIILIKSIDYALSKNETQTEIVRMRSSNLIMFIIIITITAVLFFFFLTYQTEISGILTLIEDTYILMSNSVMGVYYTRELVLLNNNKLTNFIKEDKISSFNNMTQSILLLFSESYSLQSNIITSNLPLLQTFDSQHQSVQMEVLLDDLTTIKVPQAFNSAFLEALTSMYHLSNLNLDEIIPTNKNVYYNIRNSLNNLLMTMQSNAKLFMEEIHSNVSIKIEIFNTILIAASVLIFIFFFTINYTHSNVIYKKTSYLEVFFEIEDEVIDKAIEKCNRFSKTLAKDEESDEVSHDGKDDEPKKEVYINPALADLEFLMVEESNPTEIKKAPPKKAKKKANNAEIKAVFWQMFFVLSFIFVYYLAITIFYSNYMTTYSGYLDYYNTTAAEEVYYLLAYNILREYFFDYKSLVYNEKVENIIDNTIDNNYNIRQMRDKILESYFSTLPSTFQTSYLGVQIDNLCYIAGDLFTTPPLSDKKITCDSFIFNSTSYGLNILLTNYVEELRNLKFNFDNILIANNKLNTNFNNTLYGTSNDPTQANPDESQDPFNIFNDQSLRNLGYVNAYIIKPTFDNVLSNLSMNINTFMNNYHLIYLILFLVLFALIIYYYFMIWRPYEDYLDSTMFKTKKMLAIIPKEVLAQYENISKLLDLGSSQSVPKKKKDPKKKK